MVVRRKRYILTGQRLVFLTPSELAEMEEAERLYRESDEGKQRCFLHESA